MISFLDDERPATTEQLRRAEEVLGVPLPAEYAQFLATRNGGRPEPNVCDLPQARELGVGVALLFGVDRAPESDLLTQHRALLGRVPADRLPVAEAEGGNLVCLSLRDGGVDFWDHEWEAEEGEDPGEDNLTRIADGFSAFIAALQPLDEPQPGAVREAWIDPALLAEFGPA